MNRRSAVLVVDDDEAILRLLADSLGDTYEVRTARDVLEAADLLQDQSFDLMVLDLNMPVVDGTELLDIFRVQPNFDNLPVLVISAYPDLIQRVASSQVQAILQKPFEVAELRRLVADTIAAARGESSSAARAPSP